MYHEWLIEARESYNQEIKKIMKDVMKDVKLFIIFWGAKMLSVTLGKLAIWSNQFEPRTKIVLSQLPNPWETLWALFSHKIVANAAYSRIITIDYLETYMNSRALYAL